MPEDNFENISQEDACKLDEERKLYREKQGKIKAPFLSYSQEKTLHRILLIGFGVILPVIAFTVNLFLMPFPFCFYSPELYTALLTGFVGITIIALWKGSYSPGLSFFTTLATFLGVVYSTVFTVGFIPLIPVSLIALIFYGIGILGFSPFLSLWVFIIAFRKSFNRASEFYKKSTLIVACIIFAIILPILYIGVRTAYAYVIRKEVSYAFNCKEEEKSNIYKNLMKKPWLKSALVNYYAYNQTPYDTIAGYLQPNTYIISQEASTLYYLLYGERLEGAEKKALSKIKKGYRNARGFDTYIGDVNYYPFVTLTGCQYDGVVDLDSMISYQEVTLNVSSKWHKQEMICQFIVPPGSAVTKLSLWINGEERSGTVAVKEKAETAYNTIVSKQKDPAIITWLGENLYELKVFPVEPELPRKVRIGVTSPLSPGERGMSFKPVAILNGNFDIHENAKTSAIIDFRSYKDKFNLLSNSKNIHISALGKNEKRAEGNISGFIPAEFEIFIESPGKRPEILTSRSDNFIYLQIPFSPDFSKRKRSPVSVTYFLDSTHPMERDKFFDPGKKAIMESIKHLNPGDKFNIVAANFEVKKLFTVPQSPDVENLKQAGDFLSGLKAYGGIDIVPVMENNFFPAGYEEKPVFFGIIHSSHPLITGGGEYCLQKISRTPGITAGMILINYEENSFLTELINSSNGEILRVKDPANFEDAFYRLEKAILEEGKYKITCNCISSNKSLLPVPGEKFLLSPLNPVYIYMRIPQSKPVSGSISIQNTEGQELLRTFNINIKELSEKKATQNLEIKHAPREVSRDHIARLWAYNYILEGYHKDLKNSLSKQEFEDLIKLGRDYYMVTPYTAFIVLETEEQYKQFDIDRHYQGEMSAPSIPEPETVFIIITLLVFSGFIWYKSRRNAVVREM